MKIIIGLGNPGEKYNNTRHNVGFQTLNILAKKLDLNFSLEKKFNAEIAQTTLKDEKTILAKPQTFMNNSGLSVQALVSFYKIDPKKDLIIIYDDIDLLIGEIRTSGQSSGGHNGMQSIIQSLGTNEIKRFRIGILNLPKEQISKTSNYVLGNFSKKEQDIISKSIGQVIEEIV
ncbi:MAG: aminoacyl-tRNA hydrolase [Patescibacteria group bacterium]|nr:aminoacyl-tRNA hydrolase [Patescibacteria group bacterium]